jgi:predicted anti-sigma-YlaC factor YlaD
VECTEVLEQLADYLDEGARAELCKAIEEHLHTCRECSFYVDTVKKTIVLYQADRKVEVPAKATALLQVALATEYASQAPPRSGSSD